ncbi:nucleoside-diphosphate-sugar epimerase [Microbacterium sp. AK009]|uniref:NAD-dependent epimerase/dehydratase family protein n=1 Tax=Microbacterium sp. AK009 TaxID=2723068 RepID=UPI0015CDC5F6|nr:NAD(P)-dependent oxidoreductase [Microbacterium sp. AK009]NYF16607.1 nucleoside-diphosphate-sugar epimerase [Microbacterium sp. AK009]
MTHAPDAGDGGQGRLLVTGAAGNFGSACARHLLEVGYDIVSLDSRPSHVEGVKNVTADLTDLGQVLEALTYIDWQYTGGVDAIVHLGAIPAPGITTSGATFDNNARATHNVFLAAKIKGVKRVVWASSETTVGIPFDVPPHQVPVTEASPPMPQSTYAMVKVLEEEMARHFCRWDADLTMIGLRFSNIIHESDYPELIGAQGDPAERRWNLWGYVDARDAAQAVELALKTARGGTDVYIIAAADTVSPLTNHDLLRAEFPGVHVVGDIGTHTTLLSIDKARKDLGYEPHFSWRDHVERE